MGIFSGLFRSRDKPQNSTSGSAYRFFLGGSTSGKSVTERSAMQMTAVYTCVRILSESIAGLPVHLYRYQDDGRKKKGISCDSPNYTDYQLRQISTHILGLEEFDEQAFSRQIEGITVTPDGSLEYRFNEGRTEKWQRV